MTSYVKLISKSEIEYAPVNKDDIINYNLDVEQMLKDGYKPLTTVERPTIDRAYEINYKETAKKITEVIVWTESEEDYIARKFLEAKQNKISENSCKSNIKLNSGKFYITVDNVKASYCYNGNTKNDLNAAAINFLANIITKKQWTDEDGNTVMLTKEHVTTMLQTLDSWENPIYDRWGDYSKAIEACTTKEELDNIVIDYSDITIA